MPNKKNNFNPNSSAPTPHTNPNLVAINPKF